MQWWLDHALKDLSEISRYSRSTHPLEPHKKASIEAFRHFGEDGIQFLVDAAYRYSTDHQLINAWYQFLNLAPWNMQRALKEEAMYRAGVAMEILKEIGISYEQAKSLAEAQLDSRILNHRSTALHLYHSVTNEPALLAEKMGPYLQDSNLWARYIAHLTFQKIKPEIAKDYFESMLPSATTLSAATSSPMTLAAFAAHSEAITQHLMTQSQGPQGTAAWMAGLALVHAYPEEKAYLDALKQSLDPSKRKEMLRFLHLLKQWPYSMESLAPVLVENATSCKDFDLIRRTAEVLRHHGISLDPLVPKLHTLLYFRPPSTKGRVSTIQFDDLYAASFLLEIDPEDPKVWHYFEDLFTHILPTYSSKSNQSIPGIPGYHRAYLESLAPYHRKAAALRDRSTTVREQDLEDSMTWVTHLQINHHLIPSDRFQTMAAFDD